VNFSQIAITKFDNKVGHWNG